MALLPLPPLAHTERVSQQVARDASASKALVVLVFRWPHKRNLDCRCFSASFARDLVIGDAARYWSFDSCWGSPSWTGARFGARGSAAGAWAVGSSLRHLPMLSAMILTE